MAGGGEGLTYTQNLRAQPDTRAQDRTTDARRVPRRSGPGNGRENTAMGDTNRRVIVDSIKLFCARHRNSFFVCPFRLVDAQPSIDPCYRVHPQLFKTARVHEVHAIGRWCARKATGKSHNEGFFRGRKGTE